MLHTKFQGNRPSGSGEEGCLQFVIVVFPDHTHLLFLKGFYHIWAWRSSWSYDQNILYKFCLT